MKKWKERGKRIAVLLLTAALIGSSVDLSALTVNAAEDVVALKENVELGGGTAFGSNHHHTSTTKKW